MEATSEELQKSFKVLRGVFEGAFLDGATESTPMEDGVTHLLSRVHETLPPNESEEMIRKADGNLAGAYRVGYKAGITAGLSL